MYVGLFEEFLSKTAQFGWLRAGGCLLPMVLLAIVAALGDTGGPLFWPLITIPLALIGLAVGLFVHSIKSKDNDV